MNPLYEYARHWLRGTAVRLHRPLDIELNRDRVEAIESPGFSAQLRLVALDLLSTDDREVLHKAIAILATVGAPSDCSALKAVPAEYTRTARTAVFEIEHRARAV